MQYYEGIVACTTGKIGGVQTEGEEAKSLDSVLRALDSRTECIKEWTKSVQLKQHIHWKRRREKVHSASVLRLVSIVQFILRAALRVERQSSITVLTFVAPDFRR